MRICGDQCCIGFGVRTTPGSHGPSSPDDRSSKATCDLQDCEPLGSNQRPIPPNRRRCSLAAHGKPIQRLTELADVVIFDSPPVLAVTMRGVGRQVDGVVSCRRSSDSRIALARAVSELHNTGTNVLEYVEPTRQPDGGYSYYYYYYTRIRKMSAQAHRIRHVMIQFVALATHTGLSCLRRGRRK